MENSWENKTLEDLEKDFWSEPNFGSGLVIKCHNLRKVPLSELGIEDLRLMISQNIGLQYLIPLAIEKLEENILSEGDFYEGDLLQSVLKVNKQFWLTNTIYEERVKKLLIKNEELLSSVEIQFTNWV